MTRIIIDATHSAVHRLPADTPTVMGYDTGTSDIRWTPADWERFTGRRIHIAQNYQEALTVIDSLDGVDIENGAFTIPEAIDIAKRRKPGRRTFFYFPASMLPDVRAAIAHEDNLEPYVDLFPANWSLSMQEAAALLGGRIVAIQFASPSSNPDTLVPGTKLTLREANVDLSVALQAWLPVIRSAKPPTRVTIIKKTIANTTTRATRKVHPKVAASTIGAAIITAATSYAKSKGIHLTAIDNTVITAAGALITGVVTPVRIKR